MYYRTLILPLLIGSCLQTGVAAEDNIHFSGFARIVGGTVLSDDELAQYDKNLSFDQHSLLGLQTSYEFSPDLTLTAQVLGKSKSINSGLEWLYLNYHINEQWQIKVGKLHTPFFDYSDVINVGYAYPWVILPTEVYDSFFFNSLNGGVVEYSRLISDFSLSVQAYMGQVDENISVSGDEIEINVDYFNGMIVQLNRGALNLRVSKTLGDYRVEDMGLGSVIEVFDALGQQQAVFNQVSKRLLVDAKVDFTQFSLSYDLLDWFVHGEWTNLDHTIDLLPEITGYYVTVGYQHNQFTHHLTFSERRGRYSFEFPQLSFIGEPNADFVIAGYNHLMADRPEFNSSSITLGTRWDYQPGLAFKLDLRIAEGQPEIYLPTIKSNSFDGQATLLTGSIEWVF